MWLVSLHGFISLVQDKKDAEMIQVRARVEEDILQHFPNAKTYAHNGADYRYRARVRRTEVSEMFLNYVANDLTYKSHFKDVALAQAPKAGIASRRTAYYAVWTALAKIQDYAPYSKYKRGEEPKFLPKSYKGYFGKYDHDLASRSWSGWDNREPVDTDKDTPDMSPSLFYSDDELDAVREYYDVEPDQLTDDKLGEYVSNLVALKMLDGEGARIDRVSKPELSDVEEFDRDQNFMGFAPHPDSAYKRTGRWAKRFLGLEGD